MTRVRPAREEDCSRIAEIIVFNNRMNYLPIFRDEAFSFGAVQVLSTVRDYLGGGQDLAGKYVYDDGIVRGFVHAQDGEIKKLYVDTFFQSRGIGAALLDFAVREQGCRWLWVLEKNTRAIAFYARHGFQPSGERTLEEGTPEYVIRLERARG